MKKPTFFIVGAPKCGTTAMYNFLKSHPQIFMPDCKEPNFFCFDFEASYPFAIRDERAYLSLFALASTEKQVGEASVWYLYSQKAARAIWRFNSDARIIVMVRNPVDAMYSLHNQRLLSNNENIYNFADALEAENDRKLGQRLPPKVQIPEGLYYREVFQYTSQLQRYIDVFGPERVHVVIYDDLQTDITAAYRAVVAFLGVDAGYQPDFRVINRRRRIRSGALHAYMLRPPPNMRSAVRRWLPYRFRRRLIETIMNSNLADNGLQPLDADLRKRLTNECASDVERLSELLGRDLTHWSRYNVSS